MLGEGAIKIHAICYNMGRQHGVRGLELRFEGSGIMAHKGWDSQLLQGLSGKACVASLEEVLTIFGWTVLRDVAVAGFEPQPILESSPNRRLRQMRL